MAFNTAFYGFGFLIGAALFYLVTLLRLDAFTANLPYRVLGQQPIVGRDQGRAVHPAGPVPGNQIGNACKTRRRRGEGR